jgi:hypothetical protein
LAQIEVIGKESGVRIIEHVARVLNTEFWLLNTALAEPTKEVLQAPRHICTVEIEIAIAIGKINWGPNDVSKRVVGAFRWPVGGKCGWKRRIGRFLISRAGLFSISGHTSGRCPAHGV